MTSHEYIIWICVFAYGIHIFEKFIFNWQDWAVTVLKFKNSSWGLFYAVNALGMVAGVTSAMVGWNMPAFALIIPALLFLNAIFLQIGPAIVTRRYSPGLVSSVILFLPIASWAYYGAYLDDVLDPVVAILSLLLGAFLVLLPAICVKIQEKYTKV
jgi:hypothetical protein